jgi:hypothetical protein
MRPGFFAGVSLVVASSASAQWTVTVLHPNDGDIRSSALTGGEPGLQTGNVSDSGFNAGGLWRGSVDSWVNLTRGVGLGEVHCVASGRLGGYVRTSGRDEASLWNATTRARTVLNPAGSGSGKIFGMSATQQVGTIRLDASRSTYSAVVWSGNAASVVNLAPVAATESVAFGVHEGRQVGYVVLGGRVSRASLWSGSAASRIDLNPADARQSVATGIHGDQQVGWAQIGDLLASLWRGSAQSWVNLHPPGEARSSSVAAVYNGVQVGYVFYPSVRTAALWRGSADTYENLSLYLPPSLANDSEATCVWSDATTLYVGGYATDVATGRSRAVIWSRALVRDCVADFNGDGFVDFFDYADYVTCFETSTCPPGRTADANGDGFVDFFDYADFVVAFETAC